MKDIFKVIRKDREGSLSLTILIIFLKFICFPNLVSNYTFKWLCSVSVERTTQASNWCLSLLLSHYCIISVILLLTVQSCTLFEGKNLGSNQAWVCLSSFGRSISSPLKQKKKRRRKKKSLPAFVSLQLTKGFSRDLSRLFTPFLTVLYNCVFIVSMDLRVWIVNVKNYLKLIFFSLFRNIYPPAVLVFPQFLSSSRLHVVAYWPHVFASMWWVLI